MQNALNLLGLCRRAHRLVSGVPAVELALKRGEAMLVLLDAGASDNSKKSVRDACAFRGVQIREIPPGLLGDAVGRPGHMAAAVTDRGFSDRLNQLLIDRDTGKQNG